jgi:hypothetical protein
MVFFGDDVKRKMKNEKWKMENGKGEMENGKLRLRSRSRLR